MTWSADAFLASMGPASEEYMDTLADRRDEYAAHMATMTVTPELEAWVGAMSAKFKSDVVRVHCQWLPWLTALMVVRYGEAVVSNCAPTPAMPDSKWPAAFSDDDLHRANAWLNGTKLPRKIEYQKVEG